MLWSFILGVGEFKFSRLQNPWSSFDWFMATLGLLTFLTGVYISYTINLDKPFLKVSQIKEIIKKEGINEVYLFRFIVIYFLICLFSFIIEWQIEGYIPLFTSRPDKARVIFGIFGLHHILNSINAVLFLIIQYFIFVKAKVKKKLLLILVFILSMGNYVLFVQRFGFFIFLMMSFCLFYYTSKKVRLRTYIIFAAIGIFLIVGIQSLRTTELINAYLFYDSKMKFSTQYSEFTLPYMYISMNMENFVKYYSHIENHSFGFFTFDFLFEGSSTRRLISEYFGFKKLGFFIGGYNTYPFFWPYYYDFGIAGLAIIPFIIGFIISEIYYYLHRNPGILIFNPQYDRIWSNNDFI